VKWSKVHRVRRREYGEIELTYATYTPALWQSRDARAATVSAVSTRFKLLCRPRCPQVAKIEREIAATTTPSRFAKASRDGKSLRCTFLPCPWVSVP